MIDSKIKVNIFSTMISSVFHKDIEEITGTYQRTNLKKILNIRYLKRLHMSFYIEPPIKNMVTDN